MLHAAYYKDLPVDLIPSDYTINVLISIMSVFRNRWLVFFRYLINTTEYLESYIIFYHYRINERQPLIYNYGSTTVNRIAITDIYKILQHEGWTEGTKHAIWMHFFLTYHTLWSFMIANILLHFIPACFLDLYLISTRKEPK